MGRALVPPETRRSVTADSRVARWSPTDILARAPIEVMIGVFLVFTVGAVSTAAVVIGLPQLTSIVQSRVPVAANTGMCFMLMAVAVWGAHRGSRSGRTIAIGGSMAVALIAGATALRYLSVIDLEPDRWLFPLPPGSSVMAPPTAASLLLLAPALILTMSSRALRLVRVLCSGVAVIALINIVDAFFGELRPVQMPIVTQMALPTATAFLGLAVAIVGLRPQGTMLELLRRPNSAGALARRLLLAAIVIPLVLGLFRLAGEQAGLYDTTYGVALMTVATIVLFTLTIHVTGRAADRTEIERQRASIALAEKVAETTDLYDNAPCGYHSLDSHGYYVRVNATECSWLGYEREEMVGRMRFRDLLTPASLAEFERNFPLFKERGEVHDLEFDMLRRDGSVLPVLLNATAVRDAEGRFVMSRSTLVDDSARREAGAQREAARVAAESANVAKSEFLSRMSHELRTPLNAILGFAELLDMEDLDSAQHEKVRYIRQAGRHLLDLINEVLDISRIESGQMTMSLEPIELSGLLDEVIALVGPQAESRGIQVHAPAEGRHVYARADRQRLRQVLLNLLSNAIKYNREGGTVRVSCSQSTEENIRISVTDDGYGIAHDKLDRLFVPFDRLGAEQTEIEGTGMGLALSRNLATAMGGRLGIDSTVDVGTTAWVELVATSPAFGEPIAGAGRSAANVTPDGAQTILHIEDNIASQRLVELIAEQRPGLRLLTATQGGLGLELARHHRPDVIFLDLHLPDMSGVAVLERLKSIPETRPIPVVVITADASKSQSRRLIADGAAHFVAKPVDVEALGALLDDLLGREPS